VTAAGQREPCTGQRLLASGLPLLAQHNTGVVTMAKKPNPKAETAFVNVYYEDGSQTSNRRVPGNLFAMLDADDQIQLFIEKQDNDIAERSGRPRGPISNIQKVK
jgi:hypothetical protein